MHRRLYGWAIAAVVAGLIGMHGLGSGHGVMSMAPATSMPAASSMTIMPATLARMVTRAPSAGPAHPTTAMAPCVALPAGFLALVIVGSVLIRRGRERSGATWRARRRAARSPPCPAPHVRGVCLT